MPPFLLTLAIAALGGLGAVARYTIDSQIKRAYKAAFPLTTLVINMLASFLAGLFLAMSEAGTLSGDIKLILATGFCGGLSTFSTAMNELLGALKTEKYGVALAYLACCVVVPLLCAIFGYSVIQ
ncbi:MAG: CrcB family protein [Bifidobacteriaceae bacterium]|nr:CrcB family protein [Bifidobacteriaceae bacterium]